MRSAEACIRTKWPIRLDPFLVIQLGGEKHCESKVSHTRTQHNVPARASTQTARSGDECTNYEATAPPMYSVINLEY